MNDLEKLIFSIIEKALDNWRINTEGAGYISAERANHIIFCFDDRKIDICIEDIQKRGK